MNKPWDIKPIDDRTADTLPTFIIFCEDEVSEPNYLKYFETDKIKVNLVNKQRSMMDNVMRAIHHCKENGLAESKEGTIILSEGETQVWCVFDRDKGGTEEEDAKDDIAFDESIALAEKKGINVAWSNDSFELWVLLHFEDVDHTIPESLKRSFYYDQLTEIFRSQVKPNDQLVKILKHASYSYKKDFKSVNNFRAVVRPEMISRTADAIQRAKELEQLFASEEIHNHQKCPCTKMYKLVEELIKVGMAE